MMEEYSKAIADDVITQEEVGGILLDQGISSAMLDKELGKQKERAARLLKNKERTQKVLLGAKRLCDMLCNLPFIGKLFDGVGTLCDLVMDYSRGLYDQIPVATIITLLGAIVYFVSPVDLLPDALPFVGVLDDAAIFYGVTAAANKDIERYKRWKDSNTDTGEED